MIKFPEKKLGNLKPTDKTKGFKNKFSQGFDMLDDLKYFLTALGTGFLAFNLFPSLTAGGYVMWFVAGFVGVSAASLILRDYGVEQAAVAAVAGLITSVLSVGSEGIDKVMLTVVSEVFNYSYGSGNVVLEVLPGISGMLIVISLGVVASMAVGDDVSEAVMGYI